MNHTSGRRAEIERFQNTDFRQLDRSDGAGRPRVAGRSPEHEKFPVDARRTPGWILRNHQEDQFTDLLGDSPSTADPFSHFAEHGPVQFESSLVPPSNRFRQDEKERLFPIGPDVAHYDPGTVCQSPVLASVACVSTQRVVGGARDFLTSGCGAHEKCESRLRTRAEVG
jgi:hypothetical protein